MATVIYGSTGQRVYPRVLDYVLEQGRPRAPRGRTTLDAGFTVIELDYPRNALPVGLGRDLSRNVAAAEAVQLVGGFSNPDLLTKASPRFEEFLNDGRFHGAYGSRIQYQVASAVGKLTSDEHTRQAVVTLWDPWLDNQPSKRDYPCTVSLQFEIERGRLCMNAVMRSSDVWLGLPYDMFQFTQLQLSVATALHIPTGWYRHTALSLHIYDTDVEAAQRIIHRTPTDFSYQPEGFGEPGDSFTTIMKRARQCTNGPGVAEPTASERWYRERFASYMG